MKTRRSLLLSPLLLSLGCPQYNQIVEDCSVHPEHCRPSTDANKPPVAGVSVQELVLFGDSLRLDASGSRDPDGDSLRYFWQSAPGNPDSATFGNVSSPAFLPRKPGRYVFSLTVADRKRMSVPVLGEAFVQEPDVCITLNSGRCPTARIAADFQSGISAALENDTVWVDTGRYLENLSGFKSGQYYFSTDRAKTVLDGGFQGSTVSLLDVRWVTLRNFSITGGGPGDSAGGILCRRCSDVAIEDNDIFGNDDGIRLITSQGISMEGNTIRGNKSNGIRSTHSAFSAAGNRLLSNSTWCDSIPLDSCRTASMALENGTDAPFDVALEKNTFRGGALHIKALGTHHIEAQQDTFENGARSLVIAGHSVFAARGIRFASMGEGIRCEPGSRAIVLVSESAFHSISGAGIFCMDADSISIAQCMFANPAGAIAAKGIDLISCQKGEIRQNRISGFDVGIKLYRAPMLLSKDTLTDNRIGIFRRGDAPFPDIHEPAYAGNDTNVVDSVISGPSRHTGKSGGIPF